jgi:hypothetical protein
MVKKQTAKTPTLSLNPNPNPNPWKRRTLKLRTIMKNKIK